MTDNELKKKNRRELLELLLEQTRRVEELEAELEEKNSWLELKEQQLADKRLTVQNAGSIARAALEVNKVFEAAQAAAEQYLENIATCSRRCEKMIADTKQRCRMMEQASSSKVTALTDEINQLKEELAKARFDEQ